jgi:ribosome-binding protein aMBF1 (putative translation factor)
MKQKKTASRSPKVSSRKSKKKATHPKKTSSAKVSGKQTKAKLKVPFATKLKKLREGCGLSERTLGNITGISFWRILELEANKAAPKPEEMKSLSYVLGKSVEL